MQRLTLIIMILAVFSASALFPIPAEEAVGKFRARMLRMEKLTGVISWTSLDGLTYSGSFKYMAPDKIYVKFTSPSVKILVTNGKNLWIYSPVSELCGVQELTPGSSSGGIAALVGGYEGIASGDEAGYVIKLKNDDRVYREIILSVDGTFLLKGAIFKRSDGRVMSFSLSDVSTAAEVNPALFDFKVPEGARIVTNPLQMR